MHHPAITLRWLIVVGVAVLLMNISKGQEGLQPITLDETVAFTLSGNGPTELNYQSPGDEYIHIVVRSTHELATDEPSYVQDTVVTVWNPDGERIAYNDDHRSVRGGLRETDSMLDDLYLPEAGDYRLRVNTYGGISATAVEVLLEVADPFEVTLSETDDGFVIEGYLPPFTTYDYVFEAQIGTQLTITARDISGTLDPMIRLFDAQDVLLATNDDHDTVEVMLDVLDARIQDYIIAETGMYRLELVDFLGSGGLFKITVIQLKNA